MKPTLQLFYSHSCSKLDLSSYHKRAEAKVEKSIFLGDLLISCSGSLLIRSKYTQSLQWKNNILFDNDNDIRNWLNIIYTVLLISDSPRPHLCSKLALFNMSWQVLKVLLCFFLELSVNKYSLGLSNELLFIIIAPRAAKLWPVKVGGGREI